MKLKNASLWKNIDIILIKKIWPIINFIIAILKIPQLNPYWHNKDIVPVPGITIFAINLKKDLKPKVESKRTIFSPHLYNISKGFNGCFLIEDFLLLIFLFDWFLKSKKK